MKYCAERMTERVAKIKSAYLRLTVPAMKDPYHPEKYHLYNTGEGDRMLTLGYLRGYEKNSQAVTTRLRTSYAEAEELYEAKPLILDDELLLGHLYLPEYTAEEQEEYDRLYASFLMSSHVAPCSRKDHICPDFEKLLRLGINGLRDEIRERMKELDRSVPNLYPAMDEVKQYEFYECCLIELDAVSDLAARYAEEALRLAEESPEPRRSELLRLGRMLHRVPDEPATDFYEALQSIQFFLSTLFGLYPLGRPDRYLYPFYERDIQSGKLTREFAQELIDNFCLCVSDRVFSRAACGFIVGGSDENGDLVENDLTYLFITALDHLQLPDPNGALAVRSDTGDELLAYAVDVLSHGTSHPAFYNDRAIVDSLIRNYGIHPRDAVNYIHSTCAEISVIGKSKTFTTPFVLDLPKLLREAAKNEDCSDFDTLYNAYIERVRAETRRRAWRYASKILESARVGNDAMRICALIDDCLATGKSIYEGGARYMFVQPIFVGFATAVDSLIALSELVYKQKRLSLAELNEVTDRNFEGDEPLRQTLIHKIPHYGNDNPRADEMAARLAKSLQAIFEGGDIPMAAQMMPGTFSYINHATLGEKMSATFDGRRAGYSYSDGCSATQGADVNGPTAMILSLTSWEQSRLLGGMVVNMKFGKEQFSERKKGNLQAMIRAFMERGGIELQINVVDRATLEDARIHPEAHRDLLVRIGGYSDYFVRLTPTLQQEIIDRTEY